jgi:hypothetical protein
MDRGTYHRARGLFGCSAVRLFGFGYRAINHRSGRPEGAKGDSPGQSEAPPWVHLANSDLAANSNGIPVGVVPVGFRFQYPP